MTDMVTLLDDSNGPGVWDEGDRFWTGETPPFTLAESFLGVSAQRLLRLDDRGPDVAAWQARLRAVGYDPGPADSIFGLRTDAATRAFQRANRIKDDGIVGPKTRDAAAPPGSHRVPRARTPLSDAELSAVLRAGHVAQFEAQPSKERLCCAWAQMALEHAHGWAVWCNNVGNVTGFNWGGDYYAHVEHERVSRSPDVWKDVLLRFRAHETPEAGAHDYWRLMAGRYASVLALFDSGDAWGAAMELSRLGYYTQVAEKYAKPMRQLYEQFMRSSLSEHEEAAG